MLKKLIGGSLAACVFFGLSLSAVAETTAEDAYDYREAVMTTLKGHLVASSMIVRGLASDDGYLVKHALGLANSLAEVHRVFPAGSVTADSEALPVIWEEPEKFKAAIQKAETASQNFHKVVAGGGDQEAVGAAFREVAMSCRGCHDDFRVAH